MTEPIPQTPPIVALLDDRAPLGALLIRLAVYTALLGGLTQGMLVMASDEHYAELFNEGQVIESLQMALVLTTAVLFAVAARWCRPMRAFFGVLAALATFAAIREMDSFLDGKLPFGGWKLVASPLLIYCVWQFWAAWDVIWQQIWRWICTPSSGIVWCGLVMVTIFAQIIGQAEKWRALLGENYTRQLKRVVEESSETFGYALLLFGAIEAFFWAHRLVKLDRQNV